MKEMTKPDPQDPLEWPVGDKTGSERESKAWDLFHFVVQRIAWQAGVHFNYMDEDFWAQIDEAARALIQGLKDAQ